MSPCFLIAANYVGRAARSQGGAPGGCICRPSVSNTKATRVRVPEKINTRITQMKRHYPAYGGTTATMAIQAQ